MLDKLGIDGDIWLDSVREYNQGHYKFVGSAAQLNAVCAALDVKWLAGIRSCRRLF